MERVWLAITVMLRVPFSPPRVASLPFMSNVPASAAFMSSVLFCRASGVPTFRVPAAIRESPVRVFAPLSVSVAGPALVKAPAPEITPEKVVSLPVVLLTVSRPKAEAPRVTLPAPANGPTVSKLPFRSSVAPPTTVTREVLGM